LIRVLCSALVSGAMRGIGLMFKLLLAPHERIAILGEALARMPLTGING
jgi:hypothetical protein